jgi:hypothetical protein
MTTVDLASLFERREQAKRALDAAEAAIRNARAVYAAEQGLLIYPSVEAMRRAALQSSHVGQR